jgi:hypothetical protein
MRRACATEDDFVRTPIFRLRRIALSACGGLSLRRTKSTPRDTRFARLELGLLTTSSQRVTFYMFIIFLTFDEGGF